MCAGLWTRSAGSWRATGVPSGRVSFAHPVCYLGLLEIVLRKAGLHYRCLSVLLLFLVPTVLHAEPYREQSMIAPFQIEDQHGKSYTMDVAVRALLFSRDMDGGTVIKETLSEDGAALLNQSGAVYVADISGMPWLVRKMIAKPRMRERPYRMLLDEDGELTENLPSVEGKATLMLLDRLKVVRIVYLDSVAELRKTLESLRPSP